MNIQNPAALFQIMNLWSRFQKNHPKFPNHPVISAAAPAAAAEFRHVDLEDRTRIIGHPPHQSRIKHQLKEIPFRRLHTVDDLPETPSVYAVRYRHSGGSG